MSVLSLHKGLFVLVFLCGCKLFAAPHAKLEKDLVVSLVHPDSWGIEGHALYLQAGEGVLQTGFKIKTANGAALIGYKPGWHWGFEVGGKYYLDSNGTFAWNWSNYRNSNQRYNLPKPQYLGTVINFNNADFPTIQTIENYAINDLSLHSTIAWDQINLEAGTHLAMAEGVIFYPHADVQIARVANYQNTSAETFDSTNGIITYNRNRAAMFNGAGPRLGFELSRTNDVGVTVYGNGALGLLAGVVKSSDQISLSKFVYPYVQKDLYYSGTSLSLAKIVPTLAAKLGGQFKHELAQGILSIDLGWLFNSYVGALDTSEQYGVMSRSPSSPFTIQGLLIGFNWIGSIA